MDTEESKQHYNLKWNNFKDNLLQIVAEQLNRDLLTDVTLSCEGEFIKAHKIVLAACSLYFQRLFEVYTVPNPLIILTGVKLEDLTQLLRFMYIGEVKVSEENINSILKLANEFQVKGLGSIVFNNVINRENVLSQKSDEILQNTTSQELNNSEISKKQQLQNENYQECWEIANNHLSQTERKRHNESLGTKPNSTDNQKVNKPPIAFMIFQNEWRMKLSEKYPNENNKQLSVRLSTMWKRLSPQHKAKYYHLAKKSENKDGNNAPPPKKRKEHHQPSPCYLPKPANDDTNSKGDSSDELEIVEDRGELIDITQDDEITSVIENNNQVPGGSFSNNT